VIQHRRVTHTDRHMSIAHPVILYERRAGKKTFFGFIGPTVTCKSTNNIYVVKMCIIWIYTASSSNSYRYISIRPIGIRIVRFA